MWGVLIRKHELKCFLLENRLTLGSATSNHLVVPGLKGLYGQFQLHGTRWFFQNFENEENFELSLENTHLPSEWNLSFLPDEQFYDKFLEKFRSLFRDIVSHSDSGSFEQSLQSFSQIHFFGKAIDPRIKEALQFQYNECRREGPIERLLLRQDLTDIIVEDFDRIWIEEKGSLQLSGETFTSRYNYFIYIENLLSFRQLTLSESEPALDFVMPSGARAHIIGPPLTPAKSIYLSIRKPRSEGLELNDLMRLEFMTETQFGVIKEALRSRANILVSGATGSGKTTFLRALIEGIDPQERIIVVEDTSELIVARPNIAYLKTRTQCRAQLSSVTIQDLVRHSLRMRPDRIVIGEVRGAEALDLIYAMNTGHRGSLGSLHSSSARDALLRFQALIRLAERSLSESVTRDLIASNLQYVVHCEKIAGRRYIAEIARLRGVDGNQILLETQCRNV